MNIAIIQARLDSKRLPGKVLKELGNKAVLQWVVDAAKQIIGIDLVVVSTSYEASDDEIAAYCKANAIECFRGDKNNVLKRVADTALHYGADNVMRLTADCPFLDAHICSSVLQLFLSGEKDYYSNVEPPTWPDGLDCEVIKSQVLSKLNIQEDLTQSDREHVTLYIRNNTSKFKTENFRSPDANLAKHRWTLDNQEDFVFLGKISEHLIKDDKPLSYLKILNVLSKNPTICKMESNAQRNEGAIQFNGISISNHGFKKSDELLVNAEKVIPTGSQTFSKSKYQYPPGNAPLFVSHGRGGRVWDVDGNEFVDLVCGLLPLVLGYTDPDVDNAIRHQMDKGISFSLSTELEMRLANKLVQHIPCAESVRFGKNGSDVTSAAVRLSRAYTKKDGVVVCGYHGWQDWYIGSTTRNLGVPLDVQKHTFKAPFNDLNHLEFLFKNGAADIACIIMEVASIEEPAAGYLQGVRELCDKYNVVLIFDEVVTGFRWSLGGAQAYYGVEPDLACFGKAMANGMPLSCVVGRKDIMNYMQHIFYSGTFAGEALSLAAAIAVIDKMERLPVIEKLWQSGQELSDQVSSLFDKYGLKEVFALKGCSPWKILSISEHPNASVNAIKTRYILDMVNSGVLTLGSHNMCYAHNDSDLAVVLHAYDRFLSNVANQLEDGTLVNNLAVDPIIPIFQVRAN